MRRSLAVLASVLCLLALTRALEPAPFRVAVLYSSSSTQSWSNSNSRYVEFWALWDRFGFDADYFNVDAPTWNVGGAGTDQAWFEANYEAIFVPHFARSTTGFGYLTSFDGGVWADSPLAGDWDVNIYVASGPGLVPQSMWGMDGSTDSLKMGIVADGSRAMPTANDSMGTWRYKHLSYMRNATPDGNLAGQIADTLYTGSITAGFVTQFAIESTLFPAGVVQPIAEIDTTGGIAYPAGGAGGRYLLTWRYKPKSDKPGVVYTLAANYKNGNRSIGYLSLIELMCRETNLRPRQKIRFALTDHHPGSMPVAVSASLFDRYVDSLKAWNLKVHAAVMVAPCDWSATASLNARWPSVRQACLDGVMDWHIHSHQSTACGTGVTIAWGYDSPDTAKVRSLYNKMLATATHPDSMNLPMSAYNPKRIVPSSDNMDRMVLKVVADAGGEVVENVSATPTGASPADRIYQHGNPVPMRVPGGTAVIWSVPTADLFAPATFTALKTTFGSANMADAAVVHAWIAGIEGAFYYPGASRYYHSDACIGGGGSTDPYWSYMMRKSGELIAQFPALIEPSLKNQVQRSANF